MKTAAGVVADLAAGVAAGVVPRVTLTVEAATAVIVVPRVTLTGDATMAASDRVGETTTSGRGTMAIAAGTMSDAITMRIACIAARAGIAIASVITTGLVRAGMGRSAAIAAAAVSQRGRRDPVATQRAHPLPRRSPSQPVFVVGS